MIEKRLSDAVLAVALFASILMPSLAAEVCSVSLQPASAVNTNSERLCPSADEGPVSLTLIWQASGGISS